MNFLFPWLTDKKPIGSEEFKGLSHIGRHYFSLRQQLNLGRDGVIRSHQAAHSTYLRLSDHVYFPNMTRRVHQTLLLCGPCQIKTTRKPDQHHTLRTRVTGFPFQTLSLDFVGPFPPSHPKKNIYLLTVKDVFTKWIEAFPLKSATAAEVGRILLEEIFPRFGKCEQLHSDRGTQFTSDFMQELGKLCNIKITFTPAYNPKSNPVERVHRDLKAALVAMSSHQPSKWEDYISSILYALRSSVSRTTGFSPFQLMFGRNPIDELDTFFPAPHSSLVPETRSEYFQTVQHKLEAAFQIVRENTGMAVARQRRAYHHSNEIFEEGNLVWLFTPTLGQRGVHKLHTGWTGPWKVRRKINPVTYEIAPTEKLNHPRKEIVSIDRIRRYYPDAFNTVISPEPGMQINFDGDFFAEDILDLVELPSPLSLDRSGQNCQKNLSPIPALYDSYDSTLSCGQKSTNSRTTSTQSNVSQEDEHSAGNELEWDDEFMTAISTPIRASRTSSAGSRDISLGNSDRDNTRSFDGQLGWVNDYRPLDQLDDSSPNITLLPSSPFSPETPPIPHDVTLAPPSSPAPVASERRVIMDKGELTRASRRERYERRTGEKRDPTPEK